MAFGAAMTVSLRTKERSVASITVRLSVTLKYVLLIGHNYAKCFTDYTLSLLVYKIPLALRRCTARSTVADTGFGYESIK